MKNVSKCLGKTWKCRPPSICLEVQDRSPWFWLFTPAVGSFRFTTSMLRPCRKKAWFPSCLIFMRLMALPKRKRNWAFPDRLFYVYHVSHVICLLPLRRYARPLHWQERSKPSCGPTNNRHVNYVAGKNKRQPQGRWKKTSWATRVRITSKVRRKNKGIVSRIPYLASKTL